MDFLRANKLLVDITTNTLVDSSTSNQFSLTRQPSSYTASILLPVNGATRGAVHATGDVASGPAHQALYASNAKTPATTPRKYPPAAPVAAQLAVPTTGPMPTTIPAILDSFQVVPNPGKELPQTSCEVAHFLSTSHPPVTSMFRQLHLEM